MKIDKRLILYLDNQMNGDEKQALELELSKSHALSNQLEDYKNVLLSLKVDEQKFINEDYFVNLVPKFRKNLSVEKKPFKVKTAYALTAVALLLITLILFFNPLKKDENNSVDKLLTTLSENETAELFDYYFDNLSTMNTEQLNGTSDSLLNEQISSELNLQEIDLNHVVSDDDISIESIYSEIKSEEADLIYNEILKTKYF